MSHHTASLSSRTGLSPRSLQRRVAPIFDFAGMRDRPRAFDLEHDAGSVLSEIMGPYRRRDAVVVCGSAETVLVAERLADGLRVSFDASWSPRVGGAPHVEGGCGSVVILVMGGLVSAEDAEEAIVAARLGGARTVVLAIVTGVRSALREIARDVDAVYCANMLTLAA